MMDNITVSGYSVKLTNKYFLLLSQYRFTFKRFETISVKLRLGLYCLRTNLFCLFLLYIVIYTQLVIFMCYLQEFFADFDDL